MTEELQIEASPHLQRMQVEASELDTRIGRLQAFVEGDTFIELPAYDRSLMHDQLTAMHSYSANLHRRIERATVV